jgi:RecB family exonuclease
MSLTRPYRFLEAAAQSLSTQRADAFAALARHPDLEYWLTSQGIAPDWLDRLDDHLASRLPSRLDRGRLKRSSDELVDAYDAISGLVESLAGKPRPLAEWGDALLGVLIALYGKKDWDQEQSRQRIVVTVCEKIAEAVAAHGAIPDLLMPKVTGSEAVRLVLSAIAGETIPPATTEPAIEFLGWLELPLDDAEALIVSGFNEGFVPSSRNADPFLPNALRAHLQLQDNDLRFARDAYALSVLLASRKELRIIGGRRTARNDPLIPSRLLFAGDENLLAQKTQRWFATPAVQQSLVLPGSLQPGQEQSQFPIPTLPAMLEPISSMRVTEFRDYLACPYRYYLKQRLKLKTRNDAAEELDGGGFGSLLHDVLQKFGSDDDAKSETDPKKIRSILSSFLDDITRAKFGKHPLPAVRVQVELLRTRLESFSDWQAGWIAKGWSIAKVEADVSDEEAPFVVDDEPMFLRGRIDRIDVHRESGKYVVIDYKTGDSAKKPEQTHRKKEEWIDLQLPLYRYLLNALDIEGESVALGYVVIPKDVSRTGELLANWTGDDLSSADATAEDVVRSIRRGEFDSLTTPPPAFFEEFAAICQDDVFGEAMRKLDAEDEA